MSNTQREKGSLTLPSDAVVPLRKALVEAMNLERVQILELALKLHERLRSEEGKEARRELGKLLKQPHRSFQEWQVLERLAQAFAPPPPSRWGHSSGLTADQFYHRLHAAIELIIPYSSKDGMPRKVRLPKKKDMPPLPAATWEFSGDECSVAIDPKTRTLRWEVEENNHSVDRAWESVLGKTLHAALQKVQWTRGSGGKFTYSDEHTREADWDSGGEYGATQVSRRYGPLGEDDLKPLLRKLKR